MYTLVNTISISPLIDANNITERKVKEYVKEHKEYKFLTHHIQRRKKDRDLVLINHIWQFINLSTIQVGKGRKICLYKSSHIYSKCLKLSKILHRNPDSHRAEYDTTGPGKMLACPLRPATFCTWLRSIQL